MHVTHGQSLGPEFRKLWRASTLSNLGDGIALVAAPLLAAALTRDPQLIAGLSFVQTLPWLLFALVSGAIADRVDRKRAMAYVGLLRAALFGLVGAAVLLDFVSIWLLYAVLFALATGETLFDITSTTMVPRLVQKEDLPRANARLSAAMTVTNLFLGKPIGSLLFAASAALPFLMGAGGIFAAALLVLAIHGSFAPSRRPQATASSSLVEIGQGIRWLARHRLLRTIAIVMGILNLMLVAQNSILVLYVEERLGVSPAGFGTLVALYGVGGLLGGLVAERIIRQLGASATLRLALINEAAVPAVLALVKNPLLFGAIYVAFGFRAVTWGSLLAALRQELTPDELRGRVAGAGRLIEIGGAAPGALLGGTLAARLGLTAPFWIGAIIAALLIPFAWPVFSKASVAQARQDALG